MSVEETGSLELFEGKQQEITRQELVERVSEHVNRILRRNLYELKLDERQTFRLLRQKEELRRYLKEAGTGNLQVKEYLISFIQEFLLNGMKMDEEMIKHTFFFSEKGSRQAAVRFDILLFLYKEQYGSGAMEKLIEEHGLLSGTENVITEEQIEHVYGVCGRKLKFIEQIELLSRKIYAYYKGLGAIDELRDMKIDGVSGGVSGKEGTYHSAWIFYFGAGGVSVAIGELAPGLQIDLDKVPKKYAGLDGTEIAISESQERMAVVVDPKDVDTFLKFANEENLEAVPVAVVTEEPRLVLNWRGKEIVNISRAFL